MKASSESGEWAMLISRTAEAVLDMMRVFLRWSGAFVCAGTVAGGWRAAWTGGWVCSGARAGAQGAEDARGRDDLDDLAWEKRCDRDIEESCCAHGFEECEPACAEDEDDQCREGAGEGGGSEARQACGSFADDKAGKCCGEGIGEEKAARRSEKLCDAAESMRAEDRHSGSTFREIQHHGGEGGGGADSETDEQDGEVAQRKRNGSEGQTHRQV